MAFRLQRLLCGVSAIRWREKYYIILQAFLLFVPGLPPLPMALQGL